MLALLQCLVYPAVEILGAVPRGHIAKSCGLCLYVISNSITSSGGLY